MRPLNIEFHIQGQIMILSVAPSNPSPQPVPPTRQTWLYPGIPADAQQLLRSA